MKKLLYLPIDVKVRETLAKTLLGSMAALSGYNVIIGRKKEVISAARRYRAGILLGIGAQENFSRQYQDLRSRGVKIAVSDEEGLVTFSDDIYSRTRLSRRALDSVDLYLSWGSHHDRLVRKAAPPGLNTGIVGNLRFDTLKPNLRSIHDREVNSLRDRFGSYILVVSSFAACNHFLGTEAYVNSLKEKRFITDDDSEEFFRRYISFREQCFHAFLRAVPAIASLAGGSKVVLRPHPSEHLDLWASLARNHDNVVMEAKGDIQPLIIGSSLIIHNYCTTSIEAFAADRPAIAYRPVCDVIVETERPYDCSLEAFNLEELLAAVSQILDGTDTLESKRKAVRGTYEGYVANFELRNCWTDMLEELNQISVTGGRSSFWLRFDSWRRRGLAVKTRNRDDDSYIKRKAPDFSAAEMSLTMSDLTRSFPSLSKVNCRTLDDSCFLLTTN